MQRSITFASALTILTLLAITATTGLAQSLSRVPTIEKSDNSTQKTREREAEDFSVLAQQLVEEIKKLRLEVLELRLENLGRQRAQVDRELERVRNEQHGVQEQEAKLRQAIAALDRRLGFPITEEADRAELEATKKSLLESQLPRVLAELQKTNQQEAEGLRQLTQLEQRQQGMQATIRALQGKNPSAAEKTSAPPATTR